MQIALSAQKYLRNFVFCPQTFECLVYVGAVKSSWQRGQRCLGHSPCSGGMTFWSGDWHNFITDQMSTSARGILPRSRPTFVTIGSLS